VENTRFVTSVNDIKGGSILNGRIAHDAAATSEPGRERLQLMHAKNAGQEGDAERRQADEMPSGRDLVFVFLPSEPGTVGESYFYRRSDNWRRSREK